jgi:ubiquinone/menaquinone biosynthesis C-methylase UbiE
MPKPVAAAWSPIFARVYDAAFVLAERRGLRDVRGELVGRAHGRVLELGAGTGLNLRHYPETVSEVLLTEPDKYMVAKLRKRASASPLHTSVIEAPGESLPFDNASVDTVVATLVLCTVKDPEQVLAEVSRVLRPTGAFLFVEHVRSASSRAARWQDTFNRSWSWYANGCQCNRDTVSAIEKASYVLGELRHDRLRWISPFVRPLVFGSASPSPSEEPHGGQGRSRSTSL